MAMPAEQLLAFFVVFIAMSALVIYLRNRLFMSHEAEAIFNAACKILPDPITVIARKDRECIGQYQDRKVTLVLIPSSHSTDFVRIALHGNFPAQALCMLDYPDIGDGIVWKGNTLLSTVDNIYAYDAAYLAEKLLRQLMLMAEKAQQLETDAQLTR